MAEGGGVIVRNLVLVLISLLLASIPVGAVPYPYAPYELDSQGDLESVYREASEKYTVEVSSEKESFFPWDESSYARLVSAEVIDAELNYRARQQFMSQSERLDERQELFRYQVNNAIRFMLVLDAAQHVSEGFRYVQVEGLTTSISKVVLETDKGETFVPITLYGGEPQYSYGNWWGINFVSFPRYDANGYQIITEQTEWIRLWVIAGTNRIYFEFEFYK